MSNPEDQKFIELTIMIIASIVAFICLGLSIWGFRTGKQSDVKQVDKTNGIGHTYIFTGPWPSLSLGIILIIIAIIAGYNRFFVKK